MVSNSMEKKSRIFCMKEDMNKLRFIGVKRDVS